jgi:hypothetical protein
MRRFSLALLTMMLSAGALGAQRRPAVYSGQPSVWVTGAVAGYQANGVNDGASASSWDFGNSTNWQYRGSLEKGWNNGASFGVAGSWSRVPFVYSANLGVPLPAGMSGARCDAAGCNAHLDMSTLVATFHSGAGYGFHQVLEVSAGVVAYQNLKRDSDGAKLAGSDNVDPLFSAGYGFGYGLSDRTNIDLMWDYGYAIHERKGLSNSSSNTNRLPALRVSLRMGFGARTTRR